MVNIEQFATHVASGIGRRVRDVREAMGLTQEQVAERLTAAGYPTRRATVAKTEAATRPITIEDLAALSVVLGVPLDAFLTQEFAPSPEFRALNNQLLTVQSTDVLLEELETKLQQARAELAQQERSLTARRVALPQED